MSWSIYQCEFSVAPSVRDESRCFSSLTEAIALKPVAPKDNLLEAERKNPYSSPRVTADVSLPTRLSRRRVLGGLLVSGAVFGLFATFSAVLVTYVSILTEIEVLHATPFPSTIPTLDQVTEGFCFYTGFGLVASSLATPVLLLLNARRSLRRTTAFGVMIVLGTTVYLLILLFGPRLTSESVGGFYPWIVNAILHAVIVFFPSAIASHTYAAWIRRIQAASA